MGRVSHFISQASRRSRSQLLAGSAAFLVRASLLAAAYVVVGLLVSRLLPLPGILNPLWLLAPLAVCATLAWGWHMAPAIWLGAAMGLTAGGTSLPVAAFTGVGCVLEASIAALLIRHLYDARAEAICRGPTSRFIGLVFASALVGAIFSVAALALSEPGAAATAGARLADQWLADTTALIIGIPLLLAWNVREGVEWTPAKRAEAAAFVVLLPPALVYLAFGNLIGDPPVAYLAIPFVLWAAFRFNFAAVNWTSAIICAAAVWVASHHSGPFADADGSVPLPFLMLYLAVVGITGLTVASLVEQRAEAERSLRAERDTLERRVRERTADLRLDIEARKQVEMQLANRESQLAEAQRQAQIGSWNWDLDTGAITWSDELYRIYDVSKTAFTPSAQSCRTLIHDNDLDELAACIEKCRQDGQPFRIEHRLPQRDGSFRIVAARGEGLKDENGRVTRLFGTLQDITDARRAEASLHEAEERYRQVVELSPDAILMIQDGIVAIVNPAALALLGASGSEQIVGHPLFAFLHESCHADDTDRTARLQRGETPPAMEETLVRLDGSLVEVEVKSSPFMHRGRFASLYIVRDITERKKSLEQMAYLAHYDSLTGLPNRALFHQRLAHALTVAERPERSLEILFLDLDRFKHINDTLGHAAGDAVLQETAARLQDILRESDTVARLGGDEFVVLVENVDEPHRSSAIAEKILAAFGPPFLCNDSPMSISTSIGISRFPSDGVDAETLLKNADIALYRAKESGRNNFRYYSPEMNRDTAERLAMEYALAHAVENGQMSLHYQPKIDVLTNRITGMEALLRWQHPSMGAVAPSKFIPVAEESGIIKQIGYWAIRTACQQNKNWQRDSATRLRVAVNISEKQLADENLPGNLRAILADTGLDASYLELEVNEGTIMANPDKALKVLEELRGLGVSIAIDDFGIGYATLAHLKKFPIRAVKIDRSFVQGLPYNRGDSAVAKAIIGLAHGLECRVIAEGTETQQQYDFLREHECDSVQGYYFSEPMPADHFADLLRVQSKMHLH